MIVARRNYMPAQIIYEIAGVVAKLFQIRIECAQCLRYEMGSAWLSKVICLPKGTALRQETRAVC